MSKSDDDMATGRLVITTPRRYGKWAEWNRHRNEAVKFAPKVDTRPAYKIPVKELVAGMCAVAGGPYDDRAIQGVREYWQTRPDGLNSYMWVMLPGPSPRELACMCSVWGVDWVRENGLQGAGMAVCEPLWRGRAARQHQGVCPVAPVPGRHGGMRLWPAPWRGAAWSWDSTPGTDRYLDGKGRPQISTTGLGRVSYGIATDRDWADAMLQCFFLPPEPQEERHEPTPWAPHAGYDDLAVRYG